MKIVIIAVAMMIAGGAGAGAIIVLTWPAPPMIPSDGAHVGRTTCFECHETGEAGVQFPSSHLKKIEKEKLTDNINKCLKCHKIERS